MVANLLLDAGHVRPALISGPDEASTIRDRKLRFLGQLAERGVRHVPVAGGEISHTVGYQIAHRFLAVSPAPDALFCASDLLAFGALDAIRERGLRVPQDISVVGFDDVPMAAWPVFDLTTVRQQAKTRMSALK